MHLVPFSLIALALVACSSQPVSTGVVEQAAPAPPTLAGAAQIRPGRWRSTVNASGFQVPNVQCVTDPDLNRLIENFPTGCTLSNNFQRTADGWVNEAQCTGARGPSSVRVVVRGDLQSAYVADATMSGGGLSRPLQIHAEGAYEGACRGDE